MINTMTLIGYAGLQYNNDTDTYKTVARIPIYRDRNKQFRTKDGRFVRCQLAIACGRDKLYCTPYGDMLTEDK